MNFLSLHSGSLRSVIVPPPRPFKRFKSCKPIKVKWYYGADVPIAKPKWYNYKPKKGPEKFTPFDSYDNARLERAYSAGEKMVAVKEDKLHEVNLEKMHLYTIYWNGPVYEVRRGTWFTYEGKPIKDELARKIEAGYNATLAYLLNRRKGHTHTSSSHKLPRELTCKFNDQVQQPKEHNFDGDKALDIENETDIHDLGDGQAVIFFDDIYGALFPKSLSTFQVNIIRSLKPSYGSLMSVVPIQRGFSDSLASSVIDSVTPRNVTSLTDYFHSEVATIFDSETASKSNESEKEKQDRIQDENSPIPNRRIEHLMLCVHGIGQLLGYKYESVNFSHSINVMRTKMNTIYKNEEKYQKLAHGDAFDPKSKMHTHNNTIQTLPISWRHRISFHPRRPSAYDNKSESHRLPSLSQINVEGIKPLRNVVGDVILDVLLYYEPLHLKQILNAVLSELNHVYKCYKERNPDFNGKVHLFGHSLGSAICFDLLSRQGNDAHNDYQLDFDIDSLFCVGSPVGMFELLKQKNIIARGSCADRNLTSDAPFSSPKCKNLYNVFHPSDPVSYRMEPLVDPKFAEFKPEEVPFALRGFNTQVQNLSVLGGDIQEKLWQASSWLTKNTSKTIAPQPKNSGTDIASPGLENALGDIISTLTTQDSQDQVARTTKVVKYGGEELRPLLNLNRTGRIDYCLPTGVFDIALISAINAHISYFEDEETTGFLMKEILSSSRPPVEERKVTVYNSS